MKASLHKILACPIDKAQPLKLKVFLEKEDQIIEGVLECPECHRYYPIVYGIPIMSPDDYREQSLEAPLLKKWEKYLGEEYKHKKEFKLLPDGEKLRGS